MWIQSDGAGRPSQENRHVPRVLPQVPCGQTFFLLRPRFLRLWHFAAAPAEPEFMSSWRLSCCALGLWVPQPLTSLATFGFVPHLGSCCGPGRHAERPTSAPANRRARFGVKILLHFSTVVLTRNGAQSFHSFRTGHRPPGSTDRPIATIIRRPFSNAKHIFDKNRVGKGGAAQPFSAASRVRWKWTMALSKWPKVKASLAPLARPR